MFEKKLRGFYLKQMSAVADYENFSYSSITTIFILYSFQG